MADQTTPLYEEQPQNGEDLTRPGINPDFFLWLLVLGIPALLVFLILSKANPF